MSIKNNRGFTLTEVMVAFFVFSVGLLSIFGMQITSVRQNASAGRISEAVRFASSVMEEIPDRCASCFKDRKSSCSTDDCLPSGQSGVEHGYMGEQDPADGENKFITTFTSTLRENDVYEIVVTTRWGKSGNQKDIQYVKYFNAFIHY